MSKRPRIGITMRLELETRRFYLGRDYGEAVEGAGAVPVHIPLIPKKEYIDNLVADLDGILLPGSDSDVDPSLFGEEPHPNLKNVVPEKDQTDRLVLDAAETMGLPVLGICYGMQALNVSRRGGTLIQDIDAQVETSLKHDQGRPLDRHSHSIEIDRESISDGYRPLAGNGNSLRVNSHHHQAIVKSWRESQSESHGQRTVSSNASKMNVEDRFMLGVQWHPELAWDRDPLSRDIFESFVKQCRNST